LITEAYQEKVLAQSWAPAREIIAAIYNHAAITVPRKKGAAKPKLLTGPEVFPLPGDPKPKRSSRFEQYMSMTKEERAKDNEDGVRIMRYEKLKAGEKLPGKWDELSRKNFGFPPFLGPMIPEKMIYKDREIPTIEIPKGTHGISS